MKEKPKQTRPEPWRLCWRKNVAPQLSTKGLKALLKALSNNDPSLVQRILANTKNGFEAQSKPQIGCAIGYSLMKSGYKTCLSIHNRYAKFKNVFNFTYWFDHTPMEEVRVLLAKEVEMTILERAS